MKAQKITPTSDWTKPPATPKLCELKPPFWGIERKGLGKKRFQLKQKNRFLGTTGKGTANQQDEPRSVVLRSDQA